MPPLHATHNFDVIGGQQETLFVATKEGVRAIERGLWSISLAHRDADIEDALARAERAFARHASTWQSS